MGASLHSTRAGSAERVAGAAIRRKGSRATEGRAGASDLRGELEAFLRGLDLPPIPALTGETSLLRSGLLDSTALFHLVDWIERRVGAPVDPTALDLVQEWDTVSRILDFIERRSGAGGKDAPGSTGRANR